MNPLAFGLFMMAGGLMALLIMTSILSSPAGPAFEQATTNLGVLNLVATLAVGGLLLLRRRSN